MNDRGSPPVSNLTVVVKVLAAVAPAALIPGLFPSRAKLVYLLCLMIGGVFWYVVPPRGSVRQLLVLLACAALLGLVRYMLP